MFYQEPNSIMPEYRIYRLRETLRANFRWAPHTSGVAQAKAKDYSEDGSAEASSPYDLWHKLAGTERALQLGDILESSDSEICICKYVGFEKAQWVLPEVKTGLESVPAASGPQAAEVG